MSLTKLEYTKGEHEEVSTRNIVLVSTNTSDDKFMVQVTRDDTKKNMKN